MRKVTYYLTDELDAALEALTRHTGKTRSDIIRQAIAEYTEKVRAELDHVDGEIDRAEGQRSADPVVNS